MRNLSGSEEVRKYTEICYKFECDCGKSTHSYTHLMAGGSHPSFGPWWCDECGQGYKGVWDKIANDYTITKAEKGIPGYLLLEIPPQKESIFIATKMLKQPMYDSPENFEESMHYYVEEGSCPSNFLSNTEDVRIGENTDPHGLLKFITFRPKGASDESPWIQAGIPQKT